MTLVDASGSQEADAAQDDWTTAMRAGDFERAWQLGDRHLAALRERGGDKHAGPRHLQHIWRGEDLRGKRVLVRCYHGLGDTIQFARFLPALRHMANAVTVWCQPELISFVERVDGVDRVIPLHDGRPETDFDVDIEIMELAHAVRAQSEQVAIRKPYLDVGRCHPAAPPREGVLSVGLVWEVGNWDKRRSIPAHLLRSLNVDGVRLYSLQRDSEPGGVRTVGALDISTPDIETLACELMRLDLLLCVDTMVAHLAGALGGEAWIMLHANCDWRWPASGSRSLWYPRARLFHQPAAGDWAGVIDKVRIALAERLGGRSASKLPQGLATIPARASI
jgi:hypothetical protein